MFILAKFNIIGISGCMQAGKKVTIRNLCCNLLLSIMMKNYKISKLLLFRGRPIWKNVAGINFRGKDQKPQMRESFYP